ncbi:MAG: hypothetical protein E6I92_11360 [Chloroflexi bacterium]|nr:MAG: hypothetical protein E6I92_11360 [Chloroflexota bacterium]
MRLRRLHLRDQPRQLAADHVLLVHDLLQRVEVRDQQVTGVVVAVQVGLTCVAIALQLHQVGLEPVLKGVRALPRYHCVGGRDQRLTQVAGPRDEDPEGIGLTVDRARHRGELLLLDLDPRLSVRDLRVEPRDLRLEPGDERLLPRDLRHERLLDARKLVQRRREAMLGGQRVGDVASEASGQQVVRRLVWIRRRRARHARARRRRLGGTWGGIGGGHARDLER